MTPPSFVHSRWPGEDGREETGEPEDLYLRSFLVLLFWNKVSILLTACRAKEQKGAHCDMYRDTWRPFAAHFNAVLRVARLNGAGGAHPVARIPLPVTPERNTHS